MAFGLPLFVMNVILTRVVFEPEQILGHLSVLDECKQIFQCRTLELPWRDNAKGLSCIPPGCYPLVYEWSPRFEMMLWEIYDVPGRSECKFHTANYVRQLNGCIALGDLHTDLNGDGQRDIRNSRATVERFNETLAHRPYLTVIEV